MSSSKNGPTSNAGRLQSPLLLKKGGRRRDFSPGLITAMLLYVPVNALIMRSALAEGWVSGTTLWILFVAGGALFWGFEVIGPPVLLAGVTATWAWALVSARTERVSA